MKNVICAVTVLVVSTTRAETIFVDDDAPVGGDGLSWTTAHRYLQDALSHATNAGGAVTEIRVGQGIYTADRDEANPDGPSASNCCAGQDSPGCDDARCAALVCAVPALAMCCTILWSDVCAFWANQLCEDTPCLRDATFRLVDGVPLRGGYAGLGAPNPDERDPEVYETILSGDLLGNDGPGLENNGENTFGIVTAEDLTSPGTLDGFTITGGNGDSPGLLPGHRGAGVFIAGGSILAITDCTIENNMAREGAGIWVSGASEVIVVHCALRNNTASAGGGALWIAFGGASLERCVIENNVGGNFGAIVVGENRSLRATECRFRDNVAEFWGGAIFTAGSVVLTNCLLARNVVNQAVSTHGTGTGGAIRTAGGVADLMMADCTFVQNSVPLRGAAISNHISSKLDMFNSIVWGNVAGQGDVEDAQIYHPNPSPLARSVRYNCIQGSFKGIRNIDADPLFVDPDNGDFRLSPDSPCIDAGHNWGVPPDTADADDDGDVRESTPLDLDGNPRFVDDPATRDTGCGVPIPFTVDMGAYEFPGKAASNAIFLGDLDADRVVGIVDFLAVLANWGPNDLCVLADLDFDGAVGLLDLQILLENWTVSVKRGVNKWKPSGRASE